MKKLSVVKKVHYAARAATSWEKLLLRWSGLSGSPEARLICAVIASSIAERLRGNEESVNTRFFESGGFDNYCRVIGLNPKFVSEQIRRSADYLHDLDARMMDATDEEATAWIKSIAGKEVESAELA